MLAGTLLAAPGGATVSLVVTVWVTCIALALEGRRIDPATVGSWVPRPRLPRRFPLPAGR
jgi:hypothetical protein